VSSKVFDRGNLAKEASTMNEQITKIEDVTDHKLEGQKYGGYDGFVVETTSQKILLLIANDSCCCENWGHFWMNDKPEDFIGAEVLGVEVVDTGLDVKKVDKLYLDEGAVMFVNIKTSVGVLQFTAYNSHNGYYGHRALVSCEQLKHEETL
jgi:hypothetical protein